MAQTQDYQLATSEQIEAMLGQRLEAARLLRNINQSQLAQQAGVSRRTITRLENGHGVSLDTFIRVCSALGFADHLGNLLPANQISPVERVRRKGRERKRARSSKAVAHSEWTWDKQDGEE